MKLKNVSARGWIVAGKMIAPGQVEDVECTLADITDNDEIDIVKGNVEQVQDGEEVKEVKRGRPAKEDK
jgi:hypothetical protein